MRATPSHSPSNSSPAAVDPYPYATTSAPQYVRKQHDFDTPPSEPDTPSVSGIQSGEEEEEEEEEEAEDDGSEAERSDIDEGGVSMIPLPAYVQEVDPSLILEGGPPVERGARQNPADFSSPSVTLNISMINGSESCE